MDPLLILIILLLVIIIGYILSRPFENPPDDKVGPPKKEDLQSQYESLLQEIKILQNEIANNNNPADLINQIESKKRKAADLLRQIRPNLADEINSWVGIFYDL